MQKIIPGALAVLLLLPCLVGTETTVAERLTDLNFVHHMVMLCNIDVIKDNQ